MSYPRYVPHSTGDGKWTDTDINAVVDHVLAGETVTGFIANPFTFIIRLVGGKYQAISAAGTLNMANVRGYKLENSGTCSITADNEVEVTHGLGSTYAGITPDEVLIMPRTGGQGEYLVTARDATTFTLTTVETGNFNFDWYAKAKFPL